MAQTTPEVVLPTSAEDLARGEKLYRGSCQYCHGPQGDGGKGANLARTKLERATTDEKLANIIENGIPGTEMPGAYHMIRREVLQVSAFVRSLGKVDVKPVPGDPAKGKVIYTRNGCGGCHSIREGGVLGGGLSAPELSLIGLRRSVQHLRDAILDPNAAVPENYVAVTVTTNAGKTIAGVRLHEDTFRLVLRDNTGANHALAKADLRDIRKDLKKSTMPSYQGKLSDSELQDLLAYLVSLREPS